MSSGNYPVIIIKGENELFFCEVFPETDGEVLAVQFRIDTFFDGDGFKVGSPELLKKLFIFCHQLLIQFADGFLWFRNGLHRLFADCNNNRIPV